MENRRISGRLTWAAVLLLVASGARAEDGPLPLIAGYVEAAVGETPGELKLDPFYKKHADALGIAVVCSEKVPDAALLVARDIVIHMLAKRADLREQMVRPQDAGDRDGAVGIDHRPARAERLEEARARRPTLDQARTRALRGTHRQADG